VDIGAPGPGELRLRVHAFGLNRAEAMFRSGKYLEQPKLPGRLGYEAAGTVEAIGEGVTGFAVGDKVSTIPAFSMNRYNVYGEQAIVPAAATVKHPDNLSWEHAAAIWMQYVTAYGGLIDVARLVPGDAVIITAASSSVGLAAIQIANAAGAISIAATRTSAKREALLGHGAQHVITTEDQDLAEEVKRITGGNGARVTFDPVAGAGVETLAQAAAQGGVIILYLRCAGPFGDAVPAVRGAQEGADLTWQDAVRGGWQPRADGEGETICAGRAGERRAEADRRENFPFEKIVDAHRFMESNEQIGKIIVIVD
jgi:NADPH:quinone reductase